MNRLDIVRKLIEKAAYEDAFGPTGEGAILRQAAAQLLEDETYVNQAKKELIERLNNGVQPR